MEPAVPADPLIAPAEDVRARARAGLYVHVPFCEKRCEYCDFSTGLPSRPLVERWLLALEREIAARAGAAEGVAFSSLYFGGGTPSALAPADFRRVARALRSCFRIDADAEITLEANPESVRAERLEAWREGGVNRVSLGVQSFDPGELARLGRLHDEARPAEAVRLARRAGIERLSVDLMFGFPGHEPEVWTRTLERALALETGHLSAYAFIPEPGTPMGNEILRGESRLPDDDAQADLYAALEARASAAGLACYETSNFSRPGHESIHNLTYWLRRPYLGFGPSAHGHFGGVRTSNPYDLGAWERATLRGAPDATRESESAESTAREILLLGLRLGCGVVREDHPPAVFGSVRERYGPAVRAALREGRLAGDERAFRIAAAHRFVADDVIAWIEARSAASDLTAATSAG